MHASRCVRAHACPCTPRRACPCMMRHSFGSCQHAPPAQGHRHREWASAQAVVACGPSRREEAQGLLLGAGGSSPPQPQGSFPSSIASRMSRGMLLSERLGRGGMFIPPHISIYSGCYGVGESCRRSYGRATQFGEFPKLSFTKSSDQYGTTSTQCTPAVVTC
jgi:hypothetical protein